jgi:uncharacterized protein with NRDE domain
MGLSSDGRFAAVTNYRAPAPRRSGAWSRGDLVTGFLRGTASADAYLAAVDRTAYNPFCLLAGGCDGLWWTSSVQGGVARIPAGIHALSNHLLDSPWPKVLRAREALARALEGPRAGLIDALLAVLADRSPAADAALPDTGVGFVLERGLAPIFVSLPGYGTRCSTVVLFNRDGRVTFVERSFDAAAAVTGEVREEFRIS